MTSHAITWIRSTGPTLDGCPIPAVPLAAGAGRRVVLVDIYWTRDKDPRVPLGHACLLAVLRRDAALDTRSIVIPVNEDIALHDIAKRILEQTEGLPHAQVDIAIGAYVWNEEVLQSLLPALRSMGFQGRIIVGGPQVSYVASGLEALYPDADIFIRGAGETALHAVVRTAQRIGIHGVHHAGDVDANLQAAAALDALPSPLLDGVIPLHRQRFLRWETRRGCQFKCSFCQHRQADARVERSGFSQRRIDLEIDLICAAQVEEVAVLDPVFNTNEAPGHAVRILKRFAQQGFRGQLSLQCRAEFIDDDFIDAAARLNVRLEFGLQTIHRCEQLAIDRTNHMHLVEQALSKVRARGIEHEVSLIFGLPEQTLDSFKASVRWCLDRQVPVIKAFPLLLLRGTKLDTERARWGLVVENDIMPEVLASASFSRADREAMAAISDVLRSTERKHPDFDKLITIALGGGSDRSRWQPPSLGEQA